MNFLSNIAFLNPWMLSGLAVLPVLWYLLRVTPPAPRVIILPTARFLAGLVPETQTPSHTPWWILLLRLVIAALTIIAMAGPVYNPAQELQGSGPVRLVMDNGWFSASVWEDQTRAAFEALSQAERERREVFVLTTAPEPGETSPLYEGPMAASQAKSLVKGLKPLPWPADNKAAAQAIHKGSAAQIAISLWLSSGLDEGGMKDLAKALRAQGPLEIIAPGPESLPILLKPAEDSESGALKMAIISPSAMPPGRSIAAHALDAGGRIIDQQTVTLKPGAESSVTFDPPENLRGEIARIRISGTHGAGGTYLLDERYRRKSVGIIGPSPDTNPKPFIEARYFLRRAMEPFANLSEGQAEDVIKRNPSVIILPDAGALAPEALNGMEKWIKEGGLLLRFAGPDMAAAGESAFLLVPVPLRSGGRALDGALAWEKPQKIADFPETSPLYGIALREDIYVRNQLLADPVPDLDKKTWAALEDGTPLITAAPLGKGMLVMVHTTADAAWSDLPLSGAFVDILQRITGLAGMASVRAEPGGALEPTLVMDGFGALQKPDASAQIIQAAEFLSVTPSSRHPPGIYGRGGYELALNLGDRIKSLRTPESLPAGVAQKTYGQQYERDLLPFMLFSALVLLLSDWILMIFLAGGFRLAARIAGVAFCLLLAGASARPAQAEISPQDIKYASGLYLAYVQTGDPALDSLSQRGLENLAAVLKARTSAEPDGVVALNPETDPLIFFPLVYWPVSPSQPDLSNAALSNIQNYLNHGGAILFDSRDGAGAEGAINFTLSRLVGKLNIPSLGPIQKDHVLLRSFYLLEAYPGRLTQGALWVETQSAKGRDGVSSVIVGANDWAGAWAEGDMIRSTMTGATRQQELAFRFGVNAMIYALTGNYKEDQVHVQNILERLGQ